MAKDETIREKAARAWFQRKRVEVQHGTWVDEGRIVELRKHCLRLAVEGFPYIGFDLISNIRFLDEEPAPEPAAPTSGEED